MYHNTDNWQELRGGCLKLGGRGGGGVSEIKKSDFNHPDRAY